MGALPGQLTQAVQRDIPYHETLCLVYKLGGSGQEVLAAAKGWVGHPSPAAEQLYWAPRVSLRFYSSLSLLITAVTTISATTIVIIIIITIKSMRISIVLCFN